MAIDRILVVDDDRMLRTLLVHKLSRLGCRIDQAENGRGALDSVKSDPPGLIILDAMMPVMDGHETLRQLKSDPETAHIPVFMLTARRGETDVEDALHLGAADYVSKPFNPDDLVVRIARFVLAQFDEKPLANIA
ncbi:response regulator [Hyphomonas sp.]|jgi:CheY-like chemotaxis protein|uniref:response regulator n=1 Tax=Hyphomonas sp. TaxID=87 RepID=UPI003002E2F4|tara:strand:+ start:3864 stop:4268 length:405 start_codon:yes stop_codon:yes gene_type:complete